MSSGVYAALSASIVRMQSLEMTSNNLANAATPGYKRDRFQFEAIFRETTQNLPGNGLNFVRVGRQFTDFGQAQLAATANPLDLAIDGEGFFKLEKDGAICYSRRGSFRRDAEGFLATADGWRVVDERNRPLAIPEPQTLSIDGRGRMVGAEGEVGILPLFTFDSSADLSKLGQGTFAPAPGVVERPMLEPNLVQGRLEESNVQPLQEMAQMIEGLRAFEAYQKVIKTYGTLNSKADELGSLG